MKPLPVQLVLLPQPSPRGSFSGESLHLHTATLSVLEYCDEVLPEPPVG